MIYLNVSDEGDAKASVNTTILVTKEREWGEEILETIDNLSKSYEDIDEDDVFWYNASSTGSGGVTMEMKKGGTEGDYDIVSIDCIPIINSLMFTITVAGEILDSSEIQNIEMDYYLYFVKPGHVDSQIPNSLKTLQGRQRNGVCFQFLNFGDAGHALDAVDFAGTGAARGMMTGVAVHQGTILLETNHFKAIEHACGRISINGEFLKPGRIDMVRLVAQYFKCYFLDRHVITFEP